MTVQTWLRLYVLNGGSEDLEHSTGKGNYGTRLYETGMAVKTCGVDGCSVVTIHEYSRVAVRLAFTLDVGTSTDGYGYD